MVEIVKVLVCNMCVLIMDEFSVVLIYCEVGMFYE